MDPSLYSHHPEPVLICMYPHREITANVSVTVPILSSVVFNLLQCTLFHCWKAPCLCMAVHTFHETLSSFEINNHVLSHCLSFKNSLMLGT